MSRKTGGQCGRGDPDANRENRFLPVLSGAKPFPGGFPDETEKKRQPRSDHSRQQKNNRKNQNHQPVVFGILKGRSFAEKNETGKKYRDHKNE